MRNFQSFVTDRSFWQGEKNITYFYFISLSPLFLFLSFSFIFLFSFFCSLYLFFSLSIIAKLQPKSTLSSAQIYLKSSPIQTEKTAQSVLKCSPSIRHRNGSLIRYAEEYGLNYLARRINVSPPMTWEQCESRNRGQSSFTNIRREKKENYVGGKKGKIVWGKIVGKGKIVEGMKVGR